MIAPSMDIKSLFQRNDKLVRRTEIEQPYVRDPHMRRIRLPNVIAFLAVCIAITFILARAMNPDIPRQIFNVSHEPMGALFASTRDPFRSTANKSGGDYRANNLMGVPAASRLLAKSR
jgi:hypothetical protein